MMECVPRYLIFSSLLPSALEMSSSFCTTPIDSRTTFLSVSMLFKSLLLRFQWSLVFRFLEDRQYWRNHVVDDQYTASAISSYTFSFASKVLSLARSKRSLDLVDLPKLHLWARSSYLLENFTTVPSNKKPLWKSVIYTHYPEFIFQTSWAVMQSALQFAPQLAMYFLLKLLEQRAQGAPVENAAWGLVVALGASIVLASWTQAWEHWICWARLGQLIRAELSAMIFSKSLRRKDVKGVAKAKVTNEPDPNSTAVATNDPGGEGPSDPLFEESMEAEQPGMKSAPDGDDDEDNQKSRQSTINLVVSIYVCILHLFR